MKRITSRQNAIVGRYHRVGRGEEAGALLLDGTHLIAEALAVPLTVQHALVSAESLERPSVAALVQRLEDRGVEVDAANASVMSAVSPVRSASIMVGIGERPTIDEPRAFGSQPMVVIACDIQDPGNIGAMVRAAEAGGASGFVAAGACADPFGWKALRGSMGSALRLPIVLSAGPEAAVASARRHGCRIVATVPRDGRSMWDADLRGPLAVLVGSEGAGLSESLFDLVDERVTIPMTHAVESLNAAVTAALIVYEGRRQRMAHRD